MYLESVGITDKSVHRAQMPELPFNKLLIHFGQCRCSRKVVIPDINRLYEKEDFDGTLIKSFNITV